MSWLQAVPEWVWIVWALGIVVVLAERWPFHEAVIWPHLTAKRALRSLFIRW